MIMHFDVKSESFSLILARNTPLNAPLPAAMLLKRINMTADIDAVKWAKTSLHSLLDIINDNLSFIQNHSSLSTRIL